MTNYVHGYSQREAGRLTDQADVLVDLLHGDTIYAPGSRVLECGCGTGSQTLHLAKRNPRVHLVSMDRAADSLALAKTKLNEQNLANVTFQQADIFKMPFAPQSFDHAFVCFVLEHLPEPAIALQHIKQVLRNGGTLTVIEGDHGSWYCHPETPAARQTVACLIRIQADLGGDALIGRRLYPLLVSAGFKQVRVEPKMVYVDSSRPNWVEGFSKKTFIAMVEAVEDKAIGLGLIDRPTWRQGIEDMYRATHADGTFCYTFFKATAIASHGESQK